MATYNGENYISEQLDSIINQTFRNWTLYIHDDGSIDKTVTIIKSYEADDPRIILIEDEKIFGCASKNFGYLIDLVDAQFYALSDQDDFWLPNKLEVCIGAIKNKIEKPVLLSSDVTIVDSRLRIIHDSMWKAADMTKKVSHPCFLEVCDLYTGCTMMFNKATKNALDKQLLAQFLHDQALSFSVYKWNGEFLVLNSPTMLYRQHRANVHGGKSLNTSRDTESEELFN